MISPSSGPVDPPESQVPGDVFDRMLSKIKDVEREMESDPALYDE
jgi:hypothetical protein